MDENLTLQFEFQLKNGDRYWLPLFLKGQSVDNLEETELAITRFINQNFKQVNRYYLSKGQQPLYDVEILKDYISNKKKGALKLLVPIEENEKIKNLDYKADVKFTSDFSISEYNNDPFLEQDVTKSIDEQTIPVRSISATQNFESYTYLVVKLEDKIPVYPLPRNLKVFNRGIGFLIGMITAMSLVLTAFNWKTVFVEDVELANYFVEPIEDELIPITVRAEKPPPPPPKKTTVMIPVEKITEPELKDPDPIVVDPKGEGKIEDPDLLEFPDEVIVEDDTPFIIVEDMPAFPGCEHILDKKKRKLCTDLKIRENLRNKMTYPERAKDANIQGTVYLSFVIEKDGNVGDVQILKGVHGGRMLDKEARRLIESLPQFSPGMQQGRKVRVKHNIDIGFKLR